MSDKLISDDLLGSVAKETGYMNKFTGEYVPFKTVSNVQPDKGVENTGEDLCRKEDFEPIGQVIARFLRSNGIEQVLSSEYAYTEDNKPDINDESALDAVDTEDDILDQKIDLENYMDGRSASYTSDSAVEAERDASDELAKQSEERVSNEAEEKPSEV